MNKLLFIFIVILFANTSISNKEVVESDHSVIDLIRAENKKLADSIKTIAIVTTNEVVVLDSVMTASGNEWKEVIIMQTEEINKLRNQLINSK